MPKKDKMRTFRRFGRTDYSEVSKMIKYADFKPVCYTNINNMCEDMYDFFDNVAQAMIPKTTRRRQSLPPCISPSTSDLMKRLNNKRKLVANKPTESTVPGPQNLIWAILRNSSGKQLDGYQDETSPMRINRGF